MDREKGIVALLLADIEESRNLRDRATAVHTYAIYVDTFAQSSNLRKRLRELEE